MAGNHGQQHTQNEQHVNESFSRELLLPLLVKFTFLFFAAMAGWVQPVSLTLQG